jgi:hypothetical protein
MAVVPALLSKLLVVLVDQVVAVVVHSATQGKQVDQQHLLGKVLMEDKVMLLALPQAVAVAVVQDLWALQSHLPHQQLPDLVAQAYNCQLLFKVLLLLINQVLAEVLIG